MVLIQRNHPFANERVLLWRLFFLSVLYHFLRVVSDLSIIHHNDYFLSFYYLLFYFSYSFLESYDAMITLTPSGISMFSSKFSELTVISCRLEQKLKAYCPIVVTDLGITMFLSPVQRSKTASPIFVMPSGITMLVRLVQPLNASCPISVTLLGTVMLARAV